jgi:GTP-binding protein
VYSRAEFISSAAQPADFPGDEGIEIAFAGRSNCGKSSAINAITGRRNLARTSRTPGRTQLINFFELAPGERLVDLPGYGFARVSEAKRRRWRDLIGAYFAQRRSLGGIVLIMDSRHPLKDLDWQLIEQAQDLSLHVLLSKADKLGRAQADATLRDARRALGPRASVQLFSAVSGLGVDEARDRVADLVHGSGPDSPG